MKVVIVIRCGTVIGTYKNYRDAATDLSIQISPEGRITAWGVADTVSYDMSAWEPEEALADFLKNRVTRCVPHIEIYLAEPRGGARCR